MFQLAIYIGRRLFHRSSMRESKLKDLSSGLSQ